MCAEVWAGETDAMMDSMSGSSKDRTRVHQGMIPIPRRDQWPIPRSTPTEPRTENIAA